MNRPPEKIEGLREARLRAGLTQERLAELSGLLRQHISAIERHRLLLSDERARRLAPHLGLHPAELVVGHTAAAVLRDANKTSATLADFRELVRAFWAARTNQNLDPRLRLELVRVVGATSDHLFILWIRCVDQAKREAEIALETSPG